jgi:hypothetical protein
VDPQPGTDVLSRLTLQPSALVLLAALLGCRGGPPAPPPSLPALGGITTILRLPAEGGTALAYSPDSLAALKWQSGRGLPALSRLVGYDLDSRIVWALDSRNRLVGLDLESGQARTYLTGIQQAVVGPDGVAFVVDSAGRVLRLMRRATTVFPAQFSTPPSAMFGGLGGQVVAVERGDTARARLISSDRSGPPAPVGEGPVAATFWGELLALADKEEVRLVRSSDASLVRQLRLSDPATALAFSPSGHRLYVLEGDAIQLFDRFSGDRLGSISLPGPAAQFRLDASGRWLLVQPAAADSAWVIDLATGEHSGAIATAWRSDLPLVAGAAAILALQGDDVIGHMLSSIPPAPVARIVGGGTDLWLALPWVPPGSSPEAVVALAEAQAAQDSALATGEDPADQVWLQVSSSQNPDWAEDLARQLADDGFPSAVWKPRTPEDAYRVMVGPYPGRDAAEEAGRRLDRPFFVVVPPRGQ